jgi:hypothetical protein
MGGKRPETAAQRDERIVREAGSITEWHPLWLSPSGIACGVYLGNPNEADCARYAMAAARILNRLAKKGKGKKGKS